MKLNGRLSIVAGIVLGIIAGAVFTAISNVIIGIGVGCNVALFSSYGLWEGGDGNQSGKFGIMFATGVILLSILGVQLSGSHNEFISILIVWVLAFAGGLLAVAVGVLGTIAGIFKV